jgi:hypothetical protein
MPQVHAQTVGETPDRVVQVPAVPGSSQTRLATLRGFANPLPAPDIAGIVPQAGQGSLVAGVMGPRGPITVGAEPGPIAPDAFGSFGIPYTTTRVQEGDSSASGVQHANRLSTTYPYRAVGKLTMSVGYCSASVIRRGIVVTAAHCVQDFGTRDRLFSGFTFWPGHYGATGTTAAQSAPYGSWSAWSLVRPASWADGTDVGSGAARDNDLALLAMRRDSGGRFIGDRVGSFSYGWNNYAFVSSVRTGRLSTAAVTTLGYPGLMDRGAIMQRTDGPTFTTTIAGAGQLWQGSNYTSGSSGGPWVVNFSGRVPALSGGAVPGIASIMAVVGVTSWGADDPNAPKDNFASQFRQNSRYPGASYGRYGAGNIGSLMNTLCNSPAPEGGTLASRGYCG